MTAPWTPRERALRAALKVAETSLKRINSKASRKLSSECCSDAVTLVKITIECEKAIAAIRAALAEAPPPDPRDEALRLAEAAPDRARVRMMDADLKASQVELNTAKEELLKCVQWQHELRQQRAVVANQNRIQLTYLLECHRKGGITPLFLALEEYVQRLQGETK